jgi:hypothetical protein
MFSAIDWTNSIFANIRACVAGFDAPTSSTEARTLDTHAMGTAIWIVLLRIVIGAVHILAGLPIPHRVAIACTNGCIPMSMRRIAGRMQFHPLSFLSFYHSRIGCA